MSATEEMRAYVLDRPNRLDTSDRLWYDLFYDLLKSEGRSYVVWRARFFKAKDSQLKFKFISKV